MYMLWQNQPTPEELEAQEKAKQEQVEVDKKAKIEEETLVVKSEDFIASATSDSLKLVNLKNRLGDFAYSATKFSEEETVVETNLLALKFNGMNGYLSEVKLKKFVDYNKQPIYLIKDNNASFNITFGTTDSRILNTENPDLYFEPTVTKNGDITVVSMKLKASESKFLEYRYELKDDDYMIGFTIRSQGLNDVINSSQPISLDWNLKGFRHAKSISYENRYTDIHYDYEGGKDDYTGAGDADEDIEDAQFRNGQINGRQAGGIGADSEETGMTKLK